MAKYIGHRKDCSRFQLGVEKGLPEEGQVCNCDRDERIAKRISKTNIAPQTKSVLENINYDEREAERKAVLVEISEALDAFDGNHSKEYYAVLQAYNRIKMGKHRKL